jgi:hypothetical protein
MFYGPAGNMTIVSNIIHQATHAMDAGLGNFSSQLGSHSVQCFCLQSFSPAQANWTEAVDMDSCVADQAATVSYSEVSCVALSSQCLDIDPPGARHLHKQWLCICTGFSTIRSPLTSRTLSPPIHAVVLTLRPRCMNNQLGVLQTLFPRDVLFPKSCDLSVKPAASCVPASILRGVSTLTLNRKTVAQVPDDGSNRPSNSSVATSQTTTTPQANTTGINAGAIAGMVIGSFIFGVITFLVFLFWRRHRSAQAKSQGADLLHPKGKGASGRMTQPVPWAARGDENIILIENPSPGPQKDEPSSDTT